MKRKQGDATATLRSKKQKTGVPVVIIDGEEEGGPWHMVAVADVRGVARSFLDLRDRAALRCCSKLDATEGESTADRQTIARVTRVVNTFYDRDFRVRRFDFVDLAFGRMQPAIFHRLKLKTVPPRYVRSLVRTLLYFRQHALLIDVVRPFVSMGRNAKALDGALFSLIDTAIDSGDPDSLRSLHRLVPTWSRVLSSIEVRHAIAGGHVEILRASRAFAVAPFEDDCATVACRHGRLAVLKYLVEEHGQRVTHWQCSCSIDNDGVKNNGDEHMACLHYLESVGQPPHWSRLVETAVQHKHIGCIRHLITKPELTTRLVSVAIANDNEVVLSWLASHSPETCLNVLTPRTLCDAVSAPAPRCIRFLTTQDVRMGPAMQMALITHRLTPTQREVTASLRWDDVYCATDDAATAVAAAKPCKPGFEYKMTPYY
jgi:hypothetical protein